ncbi:MAG TPA: hypothetical protein VEQ60_11240, partial [Longimicrobium sp.]|nr:hypothetical protein [Longimicrobium sp.]
MEKFLLPVTLALCTFALGWVELRSAEKRAASEMALRAAQDSTATQLKYLELFYRDINNTADPRAQVSALSLLYVIEPEIGNRLARAVSQNEAYSDTIQKQAADLGVRIENLGPLINYKVVFYYPAGRADMELLARYYSQRLNVVGLQTVELRAATPEFLARIVPPRTYEIRHDSYYEDDAATQLQKLMHEENPR